MPEIRGIPLAFGRVAKGDRDRFCFYPDEKAYRVIVAGVPGGFGAGFSDYVLVNSHYGWRIKRYADGHDVGGGTCYQTRRDAAAALVNLDGLAGGTLTHLARLAKAGEAP